MSYQGGRGSRPPRKPTVRRDPDGIRLPDCSQASFSVSPDQAKEDFLTLRSYLEDIRQEDQPLNKFLIVLYRKSNYEITADKAYTTLYNHVKKVNRNKNINLLDALKRLYCFCKQQEGNEDNI